MVAVAHSAGADGLEVAPNIGLGHGDGANRLPLRHSGQPAVALPWIAIGVKVRGHDFGVQAEAHARGVDPCQLLDEHRRMTKIAACAIGFRQSGVEQASAACRLPQVQRHPSLLFPLGVVGRNFAFHKTPHLGTERFMVFTQNSTHGEPVASVVELDLGRLDGAVHRVGQRFHVRTQLFWGAAHRLQTQLAPAGT